MIHLGKKNVLGVLVDAIDYEAAVNEIALAASEQRPFSVTALAVHGVMTGVLDNTHRHRLNRFDLVVPDGQPVRWALNGLHRAKLSDRVYGPTLMLKTCARAEADGIPIFLLGSDRAMLDKLSSALHEKFPKLKIAGTRPSMFRQMRNEQEKQELIDDVKSSGAQITFVGLGCPRQEVFAYEFRESLGMPLIAVGAAFAFHAGCLSQAPRWMQDRGLEWLYRLVHEPKRLWRRYALLNPMYAWTGDAAILPTAVSRCGIDESPDYGMPVRIISYRSFNADFRDTFSDLASLLAPSVNALARQLSGFPN